MKNQTLIKEMLEYIESHLDETLSLEDIAREFNYSKFYLNRIFAKEVGYTLCKYIRLRRLSESARKLIETDQSILEIAYEAHYNSQQAYTMAFGQEYLCTPQVFRKRGQKTSGQLKAYWNYKMMIGCLEARLEEEAA